MISINVLIVFTLGSTVVAGKELWEHVNSCPQNQTEWIDRSSKFYCIKSNEKYHCVLDSTWKLVEVCIAPLTVKESEKGCPSIYIFESAPYWVFPFSPCPLQNKDCPQEDHLGYSTEQLFKYPACLQNASYRTTSGVDIQTTVSMITIEAKRKQHDEFYRTDVNYLPFVSITIILLNIASFIWNILTARALLLRIERVAKQEMPRAESLHSISSSVPLMVAKQEMPRAESLHSISSSVPLMVGGKKMSPTHRKGNNKLTSPALEVQANVLEPSGKGKKMSQNHRNHRKNELKSSVLDVQANPSKPTGKGKKMSQNHRNHRKNELKSSVLDVQANLSKPTGTPKKLSTGMEVHKMTSKDERRLTNESYA